MAEQGQLFNPDTVRAEQFKPVMKIAVHARRLARAAGGDYKLPNPQLQVDPRRGFAQAKAYEAAEAAPETPTIRGSYEAMRQHVNTQYEHLTKPKEQGGMGIKVEVTDYDPYENHWSGGNDRTARHAMEDDIRKNSRLKVLSTAQTGGHAYFSNEENDRFRAVHDVFGHMATGRGFSRHGEEAAFESHVQMFPPEAHEALASETRGQNSVVNFGRGEFPDQSKKLIGLPDWASKRGKLGPQFGGK